MLVIKCRDEKSRVGNCGMYLVRFTLFDQDLSMMSVLSMVVDDVKVYGVWYLQCCTKLVRRQYGMVS